MKKAAKKWQEMTLENTHKLNNKQTRNASPKVVFTVPVILEVVNGCLTPAMDFVGWLG